MFQLLLIILFAVFATAATLVMGPIGFGIVFWVFLSIAKWSEKPQD